VSINDDSKRLGQIKDGQPLRVSLCSEKIIFFRFFLRYKGYHIQGRMGESTNTLDANGVIVEKSTYSSYHPNIIQSKSGEGDLIRAHSKWPGTS